MLTVLYNVSQKGRPTHEELMANTLFLANAVPWRLTHRDNFPARQLAGKNTGGRWDKPSTLTASTTGPLGFIIGINEPGDNTEPKKLKIIWITYKGTIFEA